MEFKVGDILIFELSSDGLPRWNCKYDRGGSGIFILGKVKNVLKYKIDVAFENECGREKWSWKKSLIEKWKGNDGYAAPLPLVKSLLSKYNNLPFFYGRVKLSRPYKNIKSEFVSKICKDPFDRNYASFICLDVNDTPEFGILSALKISLFEFDKISKTTYYRLKNKLKE